MKKESIQSSIARTVIYTLGHIFIAICCIIFITGADLRLATIDAIVEPLINSVWYFILDYIWRVRVNSQRSYIGNES
jgi:uncharacterized membrane protein